MATKQSSAEKRQNQSEKRRIRNKQAKSSVRTAAKKVVLAAQAKDKPTAEAALLDMIKQIDTAARKGIIKMNTAARKKSRMQRMINLLNA
ncbi:MAG: 30S ribosomal protein S20 [Spirochaetes bacterium GWD1_61_31]|nr:MAG: 30S ribosomal protein S20 [Spirochaetes bacterium GWB1_60_80]OHD34785.1 MAG: 30S ribosomal protein S20 [Spirochaetes bacterium GWC1_61_12]OHD41723.1 MAG: 30S ribosomal protein S20 [Spirochaetes bacterium GWD1_61_31]OHD44611.1 MAG: 30S ribosomal protein S20 [Spirochaetes bacterium GWE1_60_18]OHD57936.1 MAG: 30S ribosomal protein S20 [Spirochaetes bacterium GWF1_60_12]HAP43938.1 30S ribosomal protein S20 [Spirochaetaceae bacterium]